MGNEGSKGKSEKPGKALKSTLGLKSGPSASHVQRHFENVQKSRILQLKNCSLKKFPEQLEEVNEILRNLELSQNKIREIPLWIGHFSELKQLHLSENIIDLLPDEIGMLRKLEVMNVAQNKLPSLPESLVGCRSLKTLNVSNNSFTVFPIVLCHLRELENLNISQNRIASLPDEISSLAAIEVNLNQNQLQSLNSSALVQCSRLKILRVEENCLAKEQFDQNLLENSNISQLLYAGNLFQEKEFQNLKGYESYQERLTASRRKM